MRPLWQIAMYMGLLYKGEFVSLILSSCLILRLFQLGNRDTYGIRLEFEIRLQNKKKKFLRSNFLELIEASYTSAV
jgi:hypothetical protein